MQTSDRVRYIAFATLLSLSACGGGGGGGSAAGGSGSSGNTGGTAPATAATISLSELNYYALPQHTLPASEAVLATGQFAVELAQRFQTKGGALSQTITCTSRGQLVLTLTDNDGDGVASAGDRISAQAVFCDPGPYADIVNGKVTVDLQAGTLLGGDKLNALVQIDDGFALSRWQVNLGGSFTIGWERTTFTQSWRVSASGKDDLKFTPPNASAVFLRAPVMTKTVDYVTARGQVSLAMRHEAGTEIALVSTPVPLTSYLNRIAEQGIVEFAGANGKVRVSTERVQSGTNANIDLLLGNSTTPSAKASNVWFNFGHGFLWWDGQWRDAWTMQPAFGTDDYIDYTFIQRTVIPDPARTTSPDAVFRIQFSRPPTSLPQLFYRFYDDTSGGPALFPSIGATAELHGALLLVRPVQALSHGRSYVIQASADGVTWTGPGTLAPDIVLYDTAGHELRLQFGGVGFVRTPGTLLASIESDLAPQLVMPSDLLHLSAMVKLENGRTATGYRWSQLSGTPLQFGPADAAATTVQWGTSRPTGIESAVVQLEVTDSTGDTQLARIAIASADAPTLPAFLFLKREGGVAYRLPATTYFSSGDILYEPGRTILRTGSFASGRNAQVHLIPPNGAPLSLGHVEQPGAIELYNLYTDPCTTHAGYYDVRDVAYASDGTLTRLAVDFKHVCDGGIPVYGSYRLNSTVPLAN